MTITICVDTNVLASSLLAPSSPSPPSTIIRMVLDRNVLLVLSEATISELYRKTSQKRYLVDRIAPSSVDELVSSLREITTIVPAPTETTSAVTRDPKDDYLLAPEIVSRVDHLVIGDRDMLEYAGIDAGFVLTAAAFPQLLGDAYHVP